MKCKKCGADLVDNAKFCVNCGTSVDNSKESVNTSYEDEELLKLYIGNNHEKIMNKGFNLPAFLIPSYYLLYRKCYSYFFIFLFVSMFFPIVILPGVIFLGIKFNEIYINQAKNEITKIKLYNSYNVEDAIKRKGGTSIVGPIVYSIVCIILCILIVLAIVFFINIVKNGSSILDDFGNYTEENEIVRTVGDMRYIVPSEYKELLHTNYSGSYTYYGTETCHFEIKTVGEFDSEGLATETINGIDYYSYSERNDDNGYSSSDDGYFTTFNEKKYSIIFKASNDLFNKCDDDRNFVMNSISFNDEM